MNLPIILLPWSKIPPDTQYIQTILILVIQSRNTHIANMTEMTTSNVQSVMVSKA